ncbi:hypothetical protein [Paracoccus sp. (in: a-proteobacteria)]|uniref:hypothetical protein n=1 Tax=Paracoccus sp. TaxID=267 RepID=UPI0028B04B6B|nr:hypothetical protein [Paracoccus sp. (in: a-proteobacteria)]
MGVVRAKVKKGAVQRPLSPADQKDTAALDAAVSMMIGILETWDHSRPIASLNRADLRKLAVAACSGFILEQIKQHKAMDAAWDDPIFAAALVG